MAEELDNSLITFYALNTVFKSISPRHRLALHSDWHVWLVYMCSAPGLLDWSEALARGDCLGGTFQFHADALICLLFFLYVQSAFFM